MHSRCAVNLLPRPVPQTIWSLGTVPGWMAFNRAMRVHCLLFMQASNPEEWCSPCVSAAHNWVMWLVQCLEQAVASGEHCLERKGLDCCTHPPRPLLGPSAYFQPVGLWCCPVGNWLARSICQLGSYVLQIIGEKSMLACVMLVAACMYEGFKGKITSQGGTHTDSCWMLLVKMLVTVSRFCPKSCQWFFLCFFIISSPGMSPASAESAKIWVPCVFGAQKARRCPTVTIQ